MDRQPISQEGYDKLREEIRQMEEVDMPAIAERIKTAREEGDLSENAEYHGAREEQGMLQARINERKARLNSCVIVDKSATPKGVVGYGSTVTVKDVDIGLEEKYEFVGPGEEDYEGEIMKILTNSPIAKAMVGKKVGEIAEAEIPKGTIRLEIIEIIDP